MCKQVEVNWLECNHARKAEWSRKLLGGAKEEQLAGRLRGGDVHSHLQIGSFIFTNKKE